MNYDIYIGSNKIGNEGAKALAESLSINTTLLILDLGNYIIFIKDS